MQLNLDLIRIDGGTQPRAELRNDVVNEYAELMRAGVAFPPISVFYDGRAYWLADGFHRIQAWHLARPNQPIEIDVIQGTLDDARWYSYGVNKAHGLRRTNEDKERAVRTALLHPKAAGLSNGQIAEHCGVNEKTVRKYRQQLEATSEIPKSKGSPHSAASEPLSKASSTSSPSSDQPADAGRKPTSRTGEARRRSGRDGRTINTAKIGASRRLKAPPPRSAAEVLAARNVGQKVRGACFVKLELPNNNVRNCAFDLLERFTFEYLEKVFQEIVCLHQQRLQKETA